MKKFLLIGDSIRLGYQDKLLELISDQALVVAPEENCRFSDYTLFNLTTWLNDTEFDVIQWNNGQWDTCYMQDGKIHTPLPHYLEVQKRIAQILLSKAPRVVFATTTPVWREMFSRNICHSRRNEDIEEYNKEAKDLLSGLGVEINDLYAPVAVDVKKFICQDMVHLTEEGRCLCAKQTAETFLRDC